MYQRKIAQWGLDKKHKAPEMRAILRLARQRQAAGQESVFRVRGRRVDIEEVYRYFKRKGEDPTRLDVRDGSPIPATVTVETPLPPAPPRLPQAQSFESFDGLPPVENNNDNIPLEYTFAVTPYSSATVYAGSESGYSVSSSSGSSNGSESVASTPLVFSEGTLAVQVIPNYPHLAMPIDPTLDLQCSRLLLCWTQCFFDAIVPKEYYSQSTANLVYKKPWRRTLSSWSRATSEGHELMQKGQTDKTLAELRDRAHANVKKHITHKSPITLLRYFEIIYTLDTSEDPRDSLYLDATLKFVLDMANLVLFPGHPIRELTRLLLHPRASQIRGSLAQQGVQKCLHILFERCDPTHPRILYAFDTQTQTFLDRQEYQKAIQEANRYRERAEYIRGDHSYEICQALRMLGDAYAAQDQHAKAIAEYEKAFDLQRHLPHAQDRGIIGVKTKRGLAAVAKSRARFEAARQHLLVAKQMAIDAFGEKDVQVKLVQVELDEVEALKEQIRQMRGELPYRPLND